ncbi:MAG: PadR family transcriptional regulator [Candidatus Micrarchaeota archaeon]|nr:PadR family transcriptional regulator [Candidatus Micrarchaeota archaeon]
MAEIQIKSTSRLFVLLLLNERKRHGYELIKQLGEKLGSKPSPGQMYPFLKQLKKNRYISSEGKEARDRQIYYLTPEGKRFVGQVLYNLDYLFNIAVQPKLRPCERCSNTIFDPDRSAAVGLKRVGLKEISA